MLSKEGGSILVVKISLLVVIFIQFILRSDQHLIPLSEWEKSFWTVYTIVQGHDVKFIEEGNADGNFVIIYSAKKKVSVSVYVDFHGELPEGVTPVGITLEMDAYNNEWSIEGGVATTQIDMSRDRRLINEILFISGHAILHTSSPMLQFYVSFSALVYFVRPITISAGGVIGGSMSLYAYSVIPYIDRKRESLEYKFEPLPDAYVKVESISGVHVSSEWLTTDEIGRAIAVVWADTYSEVDNAGLVRGKVRIKAVKDGATAEREVEINIPYAIVLSSNGAMIVGRQGMLMEPVPIINGQNLLPQDIIQVGNELIGQGAYLKVRFCNGQEAFLQSDTIGGVRAVVGQGSFDNKGSILWLTLQNIVLEIQSDPRRVARLIMYKAIGNAIDGFLGIPDPVGWIMSTPGGVVESWLMEFGEAAFQPKSYSLPNYRLTPANLIGEPLNVGWVGGVVDFYSDGMIKIYNRGATLKVSKSTSSCTIPFGGMTVDRLDIPGGRFVGVAPAPVGAEFPSITMSPRDGSTGSFSIRPEFKLELSDSLGERVIPGSVVARVDGYLLLPRIIERDKFIFLLPPAKTLSAGLHKWELEFALWNGGIVRTSATFQVAAKLPSPTGLKAVAGVHRVALYWDYESSAWANGGYRVYRTIPGGARQLISGDRPLREANFVDPFPISGGMYEVTGLDSTGQESPFSAPVVVTFPGSIPPIPQQITVSVEQDNTIGGPVILIDNPIPAFTLFRVEAAESAEGPFTDMLEGELTARNSWHIPYPFRETRRWFRITPINVDGQEGNPVIIGPLPLPAPLPPVTGVTITPNNDGTFLLRWNPWDARPIQGYCIERWTNNGWSVVANLGHESVAWVDTMSNLADYLQWRIKALLEDGGESPASAAVGLRIQPRPLVPNIIKFASEEFKGEEGEVINVRIVREGIDLDLPAFVTWSSWGWAGTAFPGIDYHASSGTIIFEAGETEKFISIPILSDNQLEPDEVFYIYLVEAEGDSVIGTPSIAEVTILDGPTISWEQNWLYTTEDRAEEINFTVILNKPPTHVVKVDYVLETSSTATPMEDFNGPISGTLTFMPGQTRATFSVVVINDDIKEGRETVIFRLLNPQGASLAIDPGNPFGLYAVLEIEDDDIQTGYVVIDETIIRLREGETRSLLIRREGGTDGVLPVFIFPIGGNAVEGLDWIITPDPLEFEDGQKEINLTITAIVDGQKEGAELVVLLYHGGHGGGVGTLLIIIEDADGPTSGFYTWTESLLSNYPVELRSPEADPDGDGFPNWIEYLWCMDPSKSDRPIMPQHSFNEWGVWEIQITVRNDPTFIVLAEFADNLSWEGLTLDPGIWNANEDGTRTGLFRFYPAGSKVGFVRFRCEWINK